MSVCTFSTAELANVAAAICDARTFNQSDLADRVCENLALISQANVACFNDRYAHKIKDQVKPSTAKAIRAAMAPGQAGSYKADLRHAFTTASLFHYNCDDEGGDFTLKIEGAHVALIVVLERLMRTLAVKAGVE